MSTPPSIQRRDFLKHSALTGAGLLAPAFAPMATAAPSRETRSETLVAQLHKSLNEKQRSVLCMPWDHELRLKVDNNWHITKQPISRVLDDDQQDLVRQIFDGLHSEEYKKEVWRQFDQDNKGDGGFGSSSIALFGNPGADKFEFVLTGRHCTRRCDGNSEAGTAFGGPIFYGHAARSFNESPKHEGNVYWFQAQRANEVYQALDGKQRKLALVRGKGRAERGNKTVQLSGSTRGLQGIPITELSSDQKDLVRKVIGDLLLPFRKEDAAESQKAIEASGFDNLHLAYYQAQDIGDDGVWDVWQIEGPNMVWYFRGDPHVHCWAHIKDPVDF